MTKTKYKISIIIINPAWSKLYDYLSDEMPFKEIIVKLKSSHNTCI